MRKQFLTFRVIIVVLLTVIASSIYSQYDSIPIPKPVNLQGPRIGITYLDADKINEKDIELKSDIITQFGWQFETDYFALEDGTAGVVEAVVLIGGLEQNLFLPSVNFLVGLRSPEGFEFGFGPNLSLSGAAFVVAVGYTFKTKYLNFPLNFAVVPSKDGVRLSLLTGFNARVNGYSSSWGSW